ncbi:MAG: putative sulfate exporter family transporter [Acetobacteraceae bacterium]|nr:putative sulfate exporter family transporter [Acetobacteraceae bacterium]
MATQPQLAGAQAASVTLPAWTRLAGGLGLCLTIAIGAFVAAKYAPLIGAPIFAIAIGVLLTNTLRGPLQLATWRIGDVSKLCLKGGIIVLGASLDISDIVRTGLGSLPLLFITIAAGLICALLSGRRMGVDWRMRCLIGMGTTICGASAIAALAPVIRAKAGEIAYAISVVFFFNMLAVFIFPLLGHLMSLSDFGFGTWAGTAVNDTSAVVAAGFAYSQDAGTTATIVKLTRTTLIIPLVIGFGLAMPWLEQASAPATTSLARRVYEAVPAFIILFVLASVLNTIGVFGQHDDEVRLLGRWVLVVALAAVGLQGHWRAFAGAGARPLVLGFLVWSVVAMSSLAVQTWTGTL